MGFFNKTLKIGENQKYDATKITSELTAEDLKELEKKNAKLINIYKGADGKEGLSAIDLAYAMDGFSKGADKDGDGKLSNSELNDYAKNLNETFGFDGKEKITAKDLKQFIKDVSAITKKHGANSSKNAHDVVIRDITNRELENAQEATEEETTEEVSTPASEEIAEKEIEETAEEDEEVPQVLVKQTPTKYTVQLGDDYTDLIKRSLMSLHEGEDGYTPSDEEIAKAKAQFEADNPNAVKSRKGKQYLLAGAEIKIRGGLEDKNNKQEVVEQYNTMVSTRRAAEKAGRAEDSSGNSAKADKEKAEVTENLLKNGYKKTLNDNYLKKTLENGMVLHFKYDPEVKGYVQVPGLCYVDKKGNTKYRLNNGDGRVEFSPDGKEIHRYSYITYKNSQKDAQNCGLRKTEGSERGIYYCEKNKTHYKYDEKTNKFVPQPQIRTAKTDGYFLNDDKQYATFLDYNGKEIYREPRTQTKGKTVSQLAKDCGLDKTFGSKHGYYCDRSTNPPTHYQWTGEEFVRRPEIIIVNADGSYATK